ncbi:enoyl-CoA hydratase/isomerase family protein [Rhodococcus sp. 14C212]|uniref:enoyl-CoA hydratase/isomerase family protein n=1 Tax=Rhodococcus sp. 14C212 TaxID=2711209 RepID=UPI0013ECAD87|nr:enoyl-CoA hydratase/isomerase family protein [Rhodococcus sp. 14C212]NGP05840.1 enoyl-CoA hydratase/isomerase family protein [Rhodococcus sp. 14C212]
MSVVEVRDEGTVRVITLNRPDRRNATSPELMTALNDALPMPNDAVRAVIVTGNGPSFSSGGDIKAKPLPIEPGSRRMREVFNPTMLRLATLPLPIIAAVNGPALGAGLSLALVADMRVASRHAVFSSGFVDVGLATDTGASFFLPRLIGYGRAFELLTTGRKVGPAEALDMGLVNRVVDPDHLMASSMELAQLLAAKPGVAVPAVKELLGVAARNTVAEQLEAEAAMYDRTATHPHRIAAKQAMVAKMSRTGAESAPASAPPSSSSS